MLKQPQNFPFIPINYPNLTPSLIESELFGYAPKRFTGASSQGQNGLFSIANNGTSMLEEIGNLPLDMQSKY